MNSTNHPLPPQKRVDDRELSPFRRKCDPRRHRTANRRSRAEAIRNRDRWTPRENNRHNTSRRQQPERTPDPGHPKQSPPQGSSDRDWRRSGLWCLPGLALCCSSRLYSTAAHTRMGRAIWPLSEAFLPLSLAVRPGTLKQVNERSNNQPLPRDVVLMNGAMRCSGSTLMSELPTAPVELRRSLALWQMAASGNVSAPHRP